MLKKPGKLTSKQTAANAYTSLSLVNCGVAVSSSSTSARINSGAIHRVAPPKKDAARVDVPAEPEKSSMTLETPKSVMRAWPLSSIRMLF